MLIILTFTNTTAHQSIVTVHWLTVSELSLSNVYRLEVKQLAQKSGETARDIFPHSPLATSQVTCAPRKDSKRTHVNV